MHTAKYLALKYKLLYQSKADVHIFIVLRAKIIIFLHITQYFIVKTKQEKHYKKRRELTTTHCKANKRAKHYKNK